MLLCKYRTRVPGTRPRDGAARTDSVGAVKRWAAVALPALVVASGLQSLRVFMAASDFYLVDARGTHPALAGLLALGVFALGSLLPLMTAGRGLRGAALVLATARLAEQLAGEPAADLVLGGVAVVAFLVLVSSAVGGADGSNLGLGLVLGGAVDVALNGATGTLSLSWQPGTLPVIVVGLLGVALVGTAWVLPRGAGRAGGWVIGPWLLLSLVAYANLGFVASVTGLSLPAAWLLVATGNVFSLALVGSRRIPGPVVTASRVVPALCTVLLVSADGPGLAAAAVVGQVSSAVLVVTGVRAGRSRWGTAAGLLLMIVLLFGYYGSYQFGFFFRSGAVLVGAAVVLALAAQAAGSSRPASTGGAPVFLAVALALPAAAVWLAWAPPGAGGEDSPSVLRIMTYNTHQGFDTSGRLNLESLASVIEAETPDVVALQEVSRGWVVDGGVDMLWWLSDRLRLPFVYGPTADGQWGNAVLSRFAVREARNVPLPPHDLPLRRGYLDVTIEAGQPVRVLATHLHHIGDEEEARLAQVETILAAWGGSPRTVVLGDLNATPGSEPVRALAVAGFVDAGFSNGVRRPTSPSGDPRRTIDYVWATEDLAPARVSVPLSTASDHLPVVVTLALR